MKANLLAAVPLLLLAAGGWVSAQSVPPLPYPISPLEAPPALFSAHIGDADVDFVLEGSWRAQLAAALGLVITPEGSVYLDPFPDFGAEAFTFTQFPRLTLSIWLQQRFFLEASAIWDFTDNPGYKSWWDRNYWLAGYRGKEGEFVRSVLIGNREVGIDTYPYLEVPETGSSSLGASAFFGAGRSSHQLLLRYDNNEPGEVIFIGKNRVDETLVELDQFMRGRFFRLPDANVQNLEVYIEDHEGMFSDGTRHYRRATVDDALLDATGGTIILTKIAAGTGAVLVYYTVGVNPVGTPGVGMGVDALPGVSISGGGLDPAKPIDFDWNVSGYFGQDMDKRQVTVNSKVCLRLWEPGEFSPFEVLAGYAAPVTVPEETSRLQSRVVPKGNQDRPVSSGVKFRLQPGDDYLSAYRDEDLRGNLRNLYPFLDAGVEDLFDPDNLLYSPSAVASPGYLRHELLLSVLTPVASYGLGTDVIPGSVQVLRNGVPESRFQLDAETGVITFLTEIAPNDRLVIDFRRRQSLAGNGDLLFVWGNTLPLGEANILQLAAGVRWNAVPGSYTEEAYTRTGSAIVSAGLRGAAGPLTYEVSAAVGLTNPDTTGRMRLLGMEGQGREMGLTESTAWPAAAPVDSTQFPGAGSLQKTNRGKLYYRDSTGRYPYETGSKPGPYTIAGDSRGDSTGRTLVLEFDLGSGQWVGTQVPVQPGQGLADLSGLKGVSMSYRGVELAGTVRAYLQIGEVGEDLDGDGVLDEELSASSPGFSFNDASALTTLRVGGGPDNEGNDRRDSEDVDGNGTLDPEGSSSYLLVPLDTGNLIDAGTTAWTALTHSFTPAELSCLRRARSLRLLVVNTGGAAASGRLEVDSISLEGSSFHIAATTGWTFTDLTAREIEEWASGSPPPAELEKAFSEVAEIFHPYGELQKVLEIHWNGGAAGQGWRAKGFTFNATEGVDYRSVVYYYRLPSPPDAPLEFSLLDDAGKGIHWTMPAAEAATDAWSKIEVSLDDAKVYRDGAAVPGATVTADAGRGSLSLFMVELASTAASGYVYLDEVHLTNPRIALGGAARARLDLEMPGTLVSLGGHPLLHDLSLHEEASGTTQGFTALYGTPEAGSAFASRTELSLGVSFVDLDANLQVAASGSEVSLSGGHRIALPTTGPVSFEDAFSLQQGVGGLDLARENRLRASLGRLASLAVLAEATSQEGLLTQTWAAELGLTPWILDLRQRLQFSNIRSGYEVPERGYLADWIGAYSLLAPWTGGAQEERLDGLDFAWSLPARPLGARLAGSIQTRSADFVTAGRTQASALNLELSLPLAFQRGEVSLFSVTPGYRRRVELVERRGAAGDLWQDLPEALESLAGQEYWFRGAPLAELFSASAEDAFREATASALSALYAPGVFLTLTRFSSSRWYDLVLPSSLEFSLTRELNRQGVLVGSRNDYRLLVQSRALNLFGALGAYPLFPFYRTDEARGSVELTATEAEGATERLELVAGQYLACDAQETRLTLENRFVYTYEDTSVWTDTVGALFTWERHPVSGVRLPLVPAKVGTKGFWSHQESLSTAVSGGEPSEEVGSIHPLNIVLAHQTSLVLPDFGFLRGGMCLGMDSEDVNGEGTYWRVGLKLTLEAQVQF